MNSLEYEVEVLRVVCECCVRLDFVVLFRRCCYFSMPFYHLLVSLLGVKMTSVGGGKPRKQSWSHFHVNLGENKHALFSS